MTAQHLTAQHLTAQPVDGQVGADQTAGGRPSDDRVDDDRGAAARTDSGSPASGWSRSADRGPLLAVARSYRSEAHKLRRPTTVVAVGALAALSVLSTVLTFALAKDGPPAAFGNPDALLPTLPALATPAGLILGFRIGSTFTGLLLLLLCAAMLATEYSQGTIRMIFMREPRRVSWLAGRMGVLLSILAVALVGAFVISAATAVLMARIRGVDTGQWWTDDALRRAGKDYFNVLIGTTCFAIAGTALSLLIRSTTAAVLVAFAWTGPLEHIIENAWPDATKYLPGLVFANISTGGSSVAGYRGPLLLGILYAVALATAGITSLARRDVTA
ncbi:ABC transporter permease subunit [Pseudofrankia sp. BMG5.37]|uniref:ABC transporter permease subunit n=1 Tax=Pseudofrankia sp. BMG5.37 TaxID=3050035 RepID=UPI002894A031|nr:ABC transporter permease subunit [Pseudofrankia sp. BMG5.37]MDT3439682.1 ABC transporter permease subunit [Pseudofrankia sp. BMG5.37]